MSIPMRRSIPIPPARRAETRTPRSPPESGTAAPPESGCRRSTRASARPAERAPCGSTSRIAPRPAEPVPPPPIPPTSSVSYGRPHHRDAESSAGGPPAVEPAAPAGFKRAAGQFERQARCQQDRRFDQQNGRFRHRNPIVAQAAANHHGAGGGGEE